VKKPVDGIGIIAIGRWSNGCVCRVLAKRAALDEGDAESGLARWGIT